MRGLIIENVANLYRVKILVDNEKKICQPNPELMATARGKFKKDWVSENSKYKRSQRRIY